jgi:hypothetical protein
MLCMAALRERFSKNAQRHDSTSQRFPRRSAEARNSHRRSWTSRHRWRRLCPSPNSRWTAASGSPDFFRNDSRTDRARLSLVSWRPRRKYNDSRYRPRSMANRSALAHRPSRCRALHSPRPLQPTQRVRIGNPESALRRASERRRSVVTALGDERFLRKRGAARTNPSGRSDFLTESSRVAAAISEL